jgi:adenylate cyclase
MSRRNRTRLLSVIVASFVSALIGFVYSFTFNQSIFGGIVTGFTMGFVVLSFEWFVLQGRYAHRTRNVSPPVFLLISLVCWTILLFTILRISHSLFAQPGDVIPMWSWRTARGMILGVVMISGINLFLRTKYLVGMRVLGNFFLGRYNRPVQEDRIFMFLDLEGSTAISERLGALRTHKLIRRFFQDVAEHVYEFGGETHRYVGDEVVVTWPTNQGLKNAAWVNCIFDIRQAIDAERFSYYEEFGVMPEFRIGLHCGEVVAGEVGEDKREIVYIGDTVNTAARLEQLCREKGTWLLVSEDILSRTELPSHIESKSLGPVTLRGRSKSMEVFTLRPMKKLDSET